MKTCSKCKLEKSESEFNRKGKGLQPWCRECNRIKSREYYANNRIAHLQTIYTIKRSRIVENKAFIKGYLSEHPCVDCGENDIIVLDFDHLSDKIMNVSKMVGDGYSLESIQKEIAKCEVVCANCHRRRTHQRRHTMAM